MRIGQRTFDLEHQVYLMGILNVTPDSFSDGGCYNRMDQALLQAERMVEEGADILDVGGESTRPGYTRISEEEEILRIVPVIKKLKECFDLPISVDTYKASVAKAAIEAGADLINDIWGLKYDEKMASVIAESGRVCCLMHNRQKGGYSDYLRDVKSDLEECIRLSKYAGISEDKIIIDPGIGFAKTLEENQILMNHLEMLKELGYPVLLGTSRKSLIGKTLNLPVEERLEGTIASNVIGVMKGCSIFRVHDVKENKRAILLANAIKQSGKKGGNKWIK